MPLIFFLHEQARHKPHDTFMSPSRSAMTALLSAMFYALAFFSLLTATSAMHLALKRAPRGASVSSLRSPSRYSFSQADSTNGASDNGLGNVGNIRYVTNITINGVEVLVALDTGSTDLWVIPPGGIGTFNDTGIQVDLTYGDGSYGIHGHIGVSPFSFGSYQIERQAFVNAAQVTIGDFQQIGIFGLMGLGFDFNTASPINNAIKTQYGEDATWGQSVLRNLFAQNPSEPNFIGIDLARTEDLEDITGGSFSIGEYDSQFTAVQTQPKLAQFPQGGDRWTTLLEGISVNGNPVTIESTISGVPAGQAQVLLDTGTPCASLPFSLFDSIYSQIPGSALYNYEGSHLWIIPCNTTTHVEFTFASQNYLLHPLDLSTISDPIALNGQEYTACVSSFTGADNAGDGAFDMSLGDSFLRNVYSVYDFGDTLPDGSTGDPYMQLLSTTDPATADAQVISVRGQTMASLPPELDPATFVLYMNAANAASNSNAGGDTSTDTSPANMHSATPPDSAEADFENGKTLVSSPGAAVGSYEDPLVRSYGPVIIGLLAGNLLVTLCLISFAVMAWIRRGSSKKQQASRVVDPHYVPVKFKDVSDHEAGYSNAYSKPYA